MRRVGTVGVAVVKVPFRIVVEFEYPLRGLGIIDRNRVAAALCFIQLGRELDVVGSSFVGMAFGLEGDIRLLGIWIMFLLSWRCIVYMSDSG